MTRGWLVLRLGVAVARVWWTRWRLAWAETDLYQHRWMAEVARFTAELRTRPYGPDGFSPAEPTDRSGVTR